jgi:flagellar hook-associated protein 1 FlgK
MGAEALFTTRQGVDTAGHNIANAQTEGYSRQRIRVKQHDPLQTHGLLIGNGVYVGGVERMHDKFIEGQLTKMQQDAGRSATRADALKQIEEIYSPELNASVSDEVSNFFGSLHNLGNFPADFTVRTAVVEAGKDLAASFRRTDSELNESRAALNERIGQVCEKATDTCREISNLNIKIQTAEAGEGQEANDLRDQRDKLVRDLSTQIEVKYYEDQHGMLCLRGPNQVLLVDGGHSATLGVMRNDANDGHFDVTITDWEGHSTRNVTNKMDGGALEALVELRDKDVPALIDKNDKMAYTLANAFNEVHAQGFGIGDFSESTGRNFFAVGAEMKGAAKGIEIDDAIVGSNDAISAASSPMAPGDNVNLNQLVRLKDAKIFPEDKVTLNEFYANYTGALGLDVVRADHIREANDLMVADLNQRRESVAGVSLDEEATSMMKWQANFTASSKVITTVDEMLDTVLSLKR